jgi:hypothetical protein
MAVHDEKHNVIFVGVTITTCSLREILVALSISVGMDAVVLTHSLPVNELG